MSPHLRGRKLTLLFVATLTIMAGTTIAPALPEISRAFSSTEHVEIMSRMVLTLPALFVAFFAPIVGTLADRFGRRRLLVGSILLYAVAGMSGVLVDSLAALLVGRAALGLAIGGIMAIGTALVGDYFEGAERERYLGLQQASTQLGGVAFVVAGGLLADVDWRAPFWVYGAALLILPAAIVFLTEPRATVHAPNEPLQRIGVSWQPILALAAMTFVINAIFYIVPSQLPFFIGEIGVLGASKAGFAIGAFNLAAAATALNFGRLRGRLPLPIILAAGLALMATGFALLSRASGMGSVYFALAVMGFGLGLVMPGVFSATIRLAPPQARGRVAGMVTSAMFLGHFASPFASQSWIGWFGYEATFLHAGLVFSALALAAFVISRPGRTGTGRRPANSTT